MTRTEFTAALDEHNLTQVRFAQITHTHPTTVSRWATGGLPIPGWVAPLFDAWRVAGVPGDAPREKPGRTGEVVEWWRGTDWDGESDV